MRMKVVRVENNTPPHLLKPGEVTYHQSSLPPFWYGCTPDDRVVNLGGHLVTTAADGKSDMHVTPSIKAAGGKPGAWNGWIERGEWRDLPG